MEDLNNDLKSILDFMTEHMLRAELNHHLDYTNNDKDPKKMKTAEIAMAIKQSKQHKVK